MPDPAPALAGSLSIPGLQGQAVKQGQWQLKPQFVCGRRVREQSWEGAWSPPLPCTGGGRASYRPWLFPLSRDDKVTASRISAIISPGRNDALLQRGRGSLLLSPLGQQGWCGLKHALLLIQDSQHQGTIPSISVGLWIISFMHLGCWD